MTKIFGVLDSNDCLIDVSRSEKGTKRYATNHGYTKIGYRTEYHVTVTHEKVNGRWTAIAE